MKIVATFQTGNQSVAQRYERQSKRRGGVSRRAFMHALGASAGAIAAGNNAMMKEASAMANEALTFANTLTTAFRLNGTDVSVTHDARVSLLDLLREQLQMSGTKKGCNEGACGACTVLVDGKRMNACMTLVASCDSRSVTTVEGLAVDGVLHAVQQAFIDNDAFQCGYCTPGQVISAVACIQEGHARSPEEIAEWMSGNICRCAAYPQIVAAVQQAASKKGS